MLEELLMSGFHQLGIPLEEKMLQRYRIYSDTLQKVNQVMNLTAITEEDEIAKLHFLDCVSVLKVADLQGKTLIDVGTGAGFPGLALKIAQQDIQLTLLDSLDKRIGFLRDTCDKLGLSDVHCVHARAEEIPEGFREKFDAATSRAVANLTVLAELCLPYVKQGGVFLAMKGPEVEQELQDAKKTIYLLGGKVRKVEKIQIPETEITHSVVVIEKIAGTPKKFPRRWAQIKKSPIA